MYLTHEPYTAEIRWQGGTGYPSYSQWSSERKCDKDGWDELARTTDGVGYVAKLWQRGKLLALTVTYWRNDRDASKEGYTEDVRVQATDLDTLWERASRKGITAECRDDITAVLEEDESPLLAV